MIAGLRSTFFLKFLLTTTYEETFIKIVWQREKCFVDKNNLNKWMKIENVLCLKNSLNIRRVWISYKLCGVLKIYKYTKKQNIFRQFCIKVIKISCFSFFLQMLLNITGNFLFWVLTFRIHQLDTFSHQKSYSSWKLKHYYLFRLLIV